MDVHRHTHDPGHMDWVGTVAVKLFVERDVPDEVMAQHNEDFAKVAEAVETFLEQMGGDFSEPFTARVVW